MRKSALLLVYLVGVVLISAGTHSVMDSPWWQRYFSEKLAPWRFLNLPTERPDKPIGEKEGASYVSIYGLILNPEKYAGKAITVTGYLGSVWPPTLFASEVDAKVGTIENSVYLFDDDLSLLIHSEDSTQRDIFSKWCNNHVVRVTGRFGIWRAKDGPRKALLNVEEVIGYSFLTNEGYGHMEGLHDMVFSEFDRHANLEICYRRID